MMPALAGIWLPIRSRPQTRSWGSQWDRFAPLALSPNCERLRIQVVERREPGRSLGFALSRDERGAKRDGSAHVGRWRGIEGAVRPSGPRRRRTPRGRNSTLSPQPERPLDVADRDEPGQRLGAGHADARVFNRLPEGLRREAPVPREAGHGERPRDDP